MQQLFRTLINNHRMVLLTFLWTSIWLVFVLLPNAVVMIFVYLYVGFLFGVTFAHASNRLAS